MEYNAQPLPDEKIFDSIEALDQYLALIRTVREQRKQARMDAERLEVAIGKVRDELDAALRDGDLDIVEQLESVLAEFERRHCAVVALASQPIVGAAPPPTTPEPVIEAHPTQDVATRESVVVCPAPEVWEVIDETDRTDDPIVDITVPSAEELTLLCEGWLKQIEDLCDRWHELDVGGLRLRDNTLNRSACLRMRSLACSLAGVQTQAKEVGMPLEVIEQAVTELRDKMQLARAYAGDTSLILPFDESQHLTTEEWEDLSRLYEGTAQAQEVWDWYWRAPEDMGQETRLDLLNAIGAQQQMLFRALGDYGGEDRLQGDLYGNLREAANSVGFLISLNAETPWETLDTMGSSLLTRFEQAKNEIARKEEKRVKEARQVAAIEGVVTWKQERSVAIASDTSLDTARQRLLPLLDECLAAGIPATNVKVRSALLEDAVRLLDGLPKYSKFLEAVQNERKRKGLDEGPMPIGSEDLEDADLPESQIDEYREMVAMFTENMRVLILGGTPRPRVPEELKGLLNCAEVEWPESKKGDRASKFETQIKRSDIVIAAKNLASHEITEKARQWTKEAGKHFVLLPSGYGVTQIIHQIYRQLIERQAA